MTLLQAEYLGVRVAIRWGTRLWLAFDGSGLCPPVTAPLVAYEGQRWPLRWHACKVGGFRPLKGRSWRRHVLRGYRAQERGAPP